MKVILSIDPIKYPLTGIGRYTYELAKTLAEDRHVESLRFLQGRHLFDGIPESAQQPDMAAELRRRLFKNRVVRGLYRAIAPRLKALTLAGLKDHIYHGPNFYLPPFGGCSVVTIHDLTPYLWTECLPDERVRFMQPEIELSLQRATMLITDSEFIRKEVAAYFGWPLSKVRTAALASAETFHPRESSSIAPLLKRYGLSPGGYCFFAGTIEPRKNIDRLLDAYTMLPARIQQRRPLVIAGYQGWKSEALHARMAKAAQTGGVRYIGFVPAEHLPLLFAGARLFVFPSLYEGFGLPVLEAMASAVPVVCSNASSLPEVAGDAAAMCDAEDVDGLHQLIRTGLEDESWRCNAVDKGLRQAARFSWKRCAQETIDVYRAALNGNDC